MKRITLLFLIFVLPCLAAYDKRLVHVLEQLRDCKLSLDEELPMVGGSAVGAAGAPHEFYLLLPYVLQIASANDLRAMVGDRSPVVRIMAATCILRRDDKELTAALGPLSEDQTKVFVAPFGCAVLKQSVSQIVADIKKHPRYFEGEAESNQSIQPTQAFGPRG